MHRYEKPSVQALLDCNRTGTTVHPDDVIVDDYSIHMTAGDNNPLDRVSFFNYADDDSKRKVREDQVSYLLPKNFRVSCPES